MTLAADANVLALIAIYFSKTFAIQINYVKVPNAVKNNSQAAAILDCNYSVRPDDVELVVKWFLNGEVVYQWIPPQKPQAMGVLKDRIDLDYKATDDPRTVHRAVKILNPTSDLAGEYKCFVSTFADEDFSVKNMIVFEPESHLVIIRGVPFRNMINFTCFASDAYPEPKLFLYKDKKDDFYNKNPLQTVEWNTSKHPDGRYSVFVVADTNLSSLNPGALIHCELRIPGTGYVRRKTLLYYPEGETNESGRKMEASLGGIVTFTLILFYALRHDKLL